MTFQQITSAELGHTYSFCVLCDAAGLLVLLYNAQLKVVSYFRINLEKGH